jgi:hypothetical protein
VLSGVVRKGHSTALGCSPLDGPPVPIVLDASSTGQEPRQEESALLVMKCRFLREDRHPTIHATKVEGKSRDSTAGK